MANNRMWLVNRATGQRVLLAAKFFAEWVSDSNVEGKLDQAFTAEIDEFRATQGSTSWTVEYEIGATDR